MDAEQKFERRKRSNKQSLTRKPRSATGGIEKQRGRRTKIARARHREEYEAFDDRTLRAMENKRLAAWQCQFKPDEPQWKLAEHEWQKRGRTSDRRISIAMLILSLLSLILASLGTWHTFHERAPSRSQPSKATPQLLRPNSRHFKYLTSRNIDDNIWVACNGNLFKGNKMNAPDSSEAKLEAALDEMKFVRQEVVDRLVLARWLVSAQFIDSKGIQSLRWSEDGLAKIRAIHALLSELNYFSEGSMPRHRYGEFNVLMDLFSSCISQHGSLKHPKPN